MLYRDRIPAATLAASTQELAFPVANLTTPQRKRIWRSLPGTSAYLTIDFGAATTIGGVVLLASNLSATGTYRVRHGSVAAMTSGVLFDSTATTAAGDTDYPDHAVWWSDTTARYLRIDLADAAAAYIALGRLLAGPSWSATVAYGATWTWDDQSPVVVTRGGQEQRDILPTVRVLSLPFDYVSDAAARSDLLEMGRRLGRSRDAAYYLTSGTGRMGRDLVVGRLTSAIEAEAFTFNAWRAKLTVRETT